MQALKGLGADDKSNKTEELKDEEDVITLK